MQQLRRRINYANVMATIAIFVALGGASYAATQLPKNSVGTKQLKKNAVNSAKVKNGSLTVGDFKKSQRSRLRGPRGVAGPSGPQGAQGPQGPSGVSGLEIVVAATPSNSENTKEEEVECPGGKRVFGGGATVEGAFTSVAIDLDSPEGNNAWRAGAHEHDATASNWELIVYAVCGNAT